MRIIESPWEMQRYADAARRAGGRIALVPTMGYLHEGHLSLMREGRRRGTILVSSLFVNPIQFGPNEDFSRYPRSMEQDCKLMESIPVDILFAPEATTMYAPGAQTWVEATEVTRGMCGAHRPGHFRGVTTVVAKLFNLTKPHVAIFGEKDYQQLRAIQRMVRDLNFDIEILPMPTVRDPDGLAMSSRNSYLSSEGRTQALSINRALHAAKQALTDGAMYGSELAEAAADVLRQTRGLSIQYVEVADAETLESISAIDRPVVLAIAAFVGKTRLIDNIVLRPTPLLPDIAVTCSEGATGRQADLSPATGA